MENRPKILIADDEPNFIQELQMVLEKKSYQVFTTANRGQAEAIVRGYRPDVIILGTIMPRGDAFLFQQWVKQAPRFCEVPILVINARREDELLKGWRREEGMQCDAEGFIAKPVNPVALLPLIEKLLDRATERIKVLVADDHAVVRDGIRAVLALQRDMQVVADAVNGKEALEKTVELSPDVILMDIVMPVMNGLEATKQICKRCPHARVLMLTQYDDEENVLASRQAGALGFISKNAVSSQLLNGIRSVNQGKQFVSTIAR